MGRKIIKIYIWVEKIIKKWVKSRNYFIFVLKVRLCSLKNQ